MPHGKRLAITGGTGFVGQHVIREALDAGYQVHALIRNPAKRPEIEHENLTWHQGALGEDDSGFLQGADCVIHIAGLIKARTREAFDAINVDAAKALASAAQDAGISRFILLSSMAARVPELSDYAASKNAGETAVRDVFDDNLAIVRAPAVFGPGDSATEPFFDAVKRGILPLPGGRHWKNRRLSIVYAPDLARDIVKRAVKGDYDGQTVSPASWPDMSWENFAQMLSNARGSKVRPFPIPLAIIAPVAAITSITSRLFGKGHLTLGKLNEFLYQDWSSDDPIRNATPPDDALRATMKYYKVL